MTSNVHDFCVVGHRGAEGHAPENTLASFQKAIDLGCCSTEMDVRLTKDGVPVVIHDETVDRTTNGHGAVIAMTAEELYALQITDSEHVPLFQDVVSLCRDKIRMHIELKASGTSQPVVEILQQENLLTQTTIGSSDSALLKEARALCATCNLMLFAEPWDADTLEVARAVAAVGFGTDGRLITQEAVQEVHDAGLVLHAYHVDDKNAGQKLIDLGVDEISTAYPELFL